MHGAWRWSVLILVACGSVKPGLPDDSDTGEEGTNPWGTNPTQPAGLSVAISSPADGAQLIGGQAVSLLASLSGASGDASVIWSAPSWQASGASATVNDLPVGSYALSVTVSSDGKTASDAVNITVDEPLPPVDYSGTLYMDTVTDAGDLGVYEYPCDHNSLTWTLESGEMWGEGSCTVDAGWLGTSDFVFVLTGQVSGTSVSGELEAVGSDTAEILPFSGSYDPATGRVDASYDQTWYGTDGSLRLYGSFVGDPVP